MTNIFIVSYDCSKLGDYFLCCNEDIQSFLSINFPETSIHCTHNGCDSALLHSKLLDYTDDYVVSI